MKKGLIALFVLAVLLVLVGCGSQPAVTPTEAPTAAPTEAPTEAPATEAPATNEITTSDAEREAGRPIFVITLEDGAQLRGELYPDVAPQSVGNFIELANSGFYDGLTFHRAVPGFMIQGGDPLGNGTGGPGWRIKGEFSANGVPNDILHEAGVLSMARSSANDSAGSQFFVMVAKATHLDGKYAAFGRVLTGAEYADTIANAPREGETPIAPQVIRSIRVETFGKEYPFDKL
ncbi:hypothetical protein FACS1894196_2780 [Clostridia bacterium]|nr:hypothetical protein FACS1894196_2780 [Clostridia bacterium]